MYDDAVRIVAETRRCSTSWLQRKLQLGYKELTDVKLPPSYGYEESASESWRSPEHCFESATK
jgi:hypothetical protein